MFIFNSFLKHHKVNRDKKRARRLEKAKVSKAEDARLAKEAAGLKKLKTTRDLSLVEKQADQVIQDKPANT